METDQTRQPEQPTSPPEIVGHFTIPDPNDPRRTLHYRYLVLNHLPLPILELTLSRIVKGLNPDKIIAFVPANSETNKYKVKTAEELCEDERLFHLRIAAEEIKNSQIAMMLQRTS
jgi:hypothetical protein